MDITEAEIARRLRDRDREVIAVIYDRYAPSLYGITVKIVRSKSQAEDVLQEAFIKIWHNAASYEPEKGNLFTWILNITRNTAIDKVRSVHYRFSGKFQEFDKVAFEKNLDHSYDPKIEEIGLRKVVDGLDEKYSMVIDLIYFKGFTQREVKEYLGIPLGTVKSRIRIALREMRKVFSETGGPAVVLGLLVIGGMI